MRARPTGKSGANAYVSVPAIQRSLSPGGAVRRLGLIENLLHLEFSETSRYLPLDHIAGSVSEYGGADGSENRDLAIVEMRISRKYQGIDHI